MADDTVPMQPMRPGDPETVSMDLVAENAERLKALFPSVFTEGRLDVGALVRLLAPVCENPAGESPAVCESPERYGLGWPGKKRAAEIARTPGKGTLLPRPDESLDWETTGHVMIEGDNLEVLKLLQRSYAGRVKLICIDPPYNTGRDFIYPDSFRDGVRDYLRLTGRLDTPGGRRGGDAETSGRYHSAWLDMMYPRLFLARDLLRQDGVAFVSIDDHEVHNLRAVMDEIFGPENFVATVIWQKVYSPKNSARHFSEDHDYLLVYARDANSWTPGLLPRTAGQNAAYKNPDNDPRGPWKADNCTARNYYSKGTYPITTPGGRVIEGPPPGTYWRYSETTLRELDADNRIWWGRDGNNTPAVKRFLSEVRQGRVPQTFWPYTEVGHNQDAKRELLERVRFASSGSVFDTPKPTALVRRILTLATRPHGGDIVLDFFAGSGTTGDAVLQANAEDGGDRRHILVQLPEPTGHADHPTVAHITRARLRAAAAALPAAPDRGFRSFTLAPSGIVRRDPARRDPGQPLLEQTATIADGRTAQEVLFELLLSRGLDLSLPVETRTFQGITVHSTGHGLLFACLPPAGSLGRDRAEAVALGIAHWREELDPTGEVSVYVRDAAFPDDTARATMAAVLDQYRFAVVKSL
ncbi:site-specific DNA-methyltransferase [Streptomyces sp. NPDC057116]|uniref:site-specific DNA-methyltransferase n=1 Tax=Streptomyces sp. NPDC057116 TaxID=3346023 RepID=UPI003631354C